MEQKIDFISIVLNGEPFVSHCISQYYKYAHKIFIIEGADYRTRDHVSKEFFTKDGHSTDHTREIIHSFPDPEHKITIIEKNGFWTSKEEMFTQTNDKIKGNWVWEVDIDEFHKDEDVEKILKIIEEYPQITGFCLPWRNFWHNFHTIYGWENMHTFKVMWGEGGWRISRWISGVSQWISHRPPNVSLGELGNTQTSAWGPAHLAPRDIYCYHYSDLLPRQNKMKSEYYEIPKWYSDIFMRWRTNKEEVENYGIYPLGGSGKTMEYRGTHPSEVYKLANELGMEI